MNVLFGIIIIAAGIIYAIYKTRKMDGLNLEIQSISTSKIADAKEIVDDLSVTDANYRHYVELKGNIFTKEKVEAPFIEREVAYYEDMTYAVSEEVETYRDKDGNKHTRTHKREEQLSHETSPVPVYLRDDSCEEGISIDISSFSDCLELQSGCDRMEHENSDWMRRHSRYHSTWGRGSGSRFLGYRLKERILLPNQPVYLLGELYKLGTDYYIGRSCIGNKPSKMTYKSEDELVASNKRAKMTSWGIAAVSVLVGIFMIYSGFHQ